MSPTLIFGIAFFLALVMLAIGVVVSVRSNRSVANERLEQILQDTSMEEEDIEAMIANDDSPLVDWLDKQVQGTSWSERTAKKLAQADLKMKPGEYLGLIMVCCVFLGLVFFFIGGQSVIGIIIGVVVGFFVPRAYLNRAHDKRLTTFDSQLPDMLNLMTNGIRAGYSTMQAMEAVSREMPPPICDEFHRVVQEMRLGVAMEDALDNLLRRIPSDDLDLVITAINVQREVGGNLAEMLETISETIRERIRIKGEIKTLTTQVMYSGKFLAIMPLLVIGALFLLNRDYMMQFLLPENNNLFGLPCGYISLGIVAIMISIGYFVMTKIADIEV
ncbi:MAG: type II secretion system F family protein [Anaerolineae bacterium]|jgi:tight adherence protein B|nr:type II secretion system F family protein [Anaerolineae bacterium]